ncbi:acyl-CoA dehydrogenase family protein [Pareuzebyella sediminis]|uniref:acyl-CoA dehydrogenase n=1 Tax=Pareuzebyella sediminis TaxID=2607998 RepID=UPI001E544619|nr:acyl-CoA dehydrogenase [Pareuzebyella sediminis]
MKRSKYDMHKLADLNFKPQVFSEEIIREIDRYNLWNLWVPKSHGGLEMSLSEGLKKLFSLAEIDGSLGWTVTLCSGANFFFGNLTKDVVESIFISQESPIRFGGSGGVSGYAEKKNEGYSITGKWKYATGATYLTHFTLNAEVRVGGKAVCDENGAPMVRSFLMGREDVEIIHDWNAMGLKATATHSFEIKEKYVPESHSFIYDRYFHDHPIFKVPFSSFADLTLWVNYLGMASHFLEEANKVLSQQELLKLLTTSIDQSIDSVEDHAATIERKILDGEKLSEKDMRTIHQDAASSVARLSQAILKVYPQLGIMACSEDHVLNHIFRDYFTAIQHHIFSRDLE